MRVLFVNYMSLFKFNKDEIKQIKGKINRETKKKNVKSKSDESLICQTTRIY